MTNDAKMTAINVETSCGEKFETPVSELTDRQLRGLLAENGDRTDVDPNQIAALRSEFTRRALKP
jgi:hypothetical protein